MARPPPVDVAGNGTGLHKSGVQSGTLPTPRRASRRETVMVVGCRPARRPGLSFFV